MKNYHYFTRICVLTAFLASTFAPTLGIQESRTQDNGGSKGIAVSYPWSFSKGTETARITAQEASMEIGQRADYAMIPADVAAAAWKAGKYRTPIVGRLPSRTTLQALGKRLKAKRVMYGEISWHTRSIWVNAGPKTISTATVNVYVLDTNSGRIVFKRTNVKARSDEKTNGYKVAAAILFTPLVTAVSGGPVTPREQRAVQIALANAYSNWVSPVKK
jgi:hypothetical protein